MGYFKNLEIELQEIHDPELREIVAWDKAHRHLMTPEERWRVLTNEVLLKRALVLWENSATPVPRPASEHVSLQVPIVSRRSLRQRKPSYRCVLVWSLVAISILTAVTIWVVWS